MNRCEATAMVDPHVRVVDGFHGVPFADVLSLLGEADYSRLRADPIRRLGPPGCVYPWNVIDYLTTLRSDVFGPGAPTA
jgi:hypothetical protein